MKKPKPNPRRALTAKPPKAKEPPARMSDETLAFEASVVAGRVLTAEERKCLTEAMRANDRMLEAKAMVDAHGVVISDRFGQLIPHPAVKIEREQRLIVLQCLKTIGVKTADASRLMQDDGWDDPPKGE